MVSGIFFADHAGASLNLDVTPSSAAQLQASDGWRPVQKLKVPVLCRVASLLTQRLLRACGPPVPAFHYVIS